MAICETTVSNISEYISAITKLKSAHEKLWFRGHSDVDYTLQPTVYRTPYCYKNEIALLHQFKARAARFISNKPIDDIEWLFIMQHHATPTRLLDWSENAFVALAFATQYRSEKHRGKNASVWCLNPLKLNMNIKFTGFDEEPIPNICANKELQRMFESARQTYPVAIIGPQNTDRIIAQRGVFTLFPEKDSFTLESSEQAELFLYKVIIPENKIDAISKDLYYLGITESTLYPEIDSISKELRQKYERR